MSNVIRQTFYDGPFTITVTRKRKGRPPKCDPKTTAALESLFGRDHVPAPRDSEPPKRRGRPRKKT